MSTPPLVQLRGLSKHFPAKIAWPREAGISPPRCSYTGFVSLAFALINIQLCLLTLVLQPCFLW